MLTPSCDNEDCFKMLIKAFTGKGIYRPVGAAMRAGEFDRIQSYLAGITETAGKFGDKYSYKDYETPVWRGISAKRAKLEDYKPGQIGTWPLFQSTSKNYDTALKFSAIAGKKKDDEYAKDHSLAVYKIYLSKKNWPATNVDTGKAENMKELSFFPKEEEVLLLPFFNF